MIQFPKTSARIKFFAFYEESTDSLKWRRFLLFSKGMERFHDGMTQVPNTKIWTPVFCFVLL